MASNAQQDLASLKQHVSAPKVEATRRSEELTDTQLMLQEATATAQQAQQVCHLSLSASTCLQSQASH